MIPSISCTVQPGTCKSVSDRRKAITKLTVSALISGIVYKSETKNDDLNPEFKQAEIDLWELTEGNLDAPLRITIHEEDSGEAKEYLGQVVVSTNELIQRKPTEPMELQAGNMKAEGYLYADVATLVDYVNIKDQVVKLQSAADQARGAIAAQQNAEKLAAEESQRAKANAVQAEKAASAAQDKVKEMGG